LLKEIEYVLDKLIRKSNSVDHSEVVQVLIDSENLKECKEQLCELVSEHLNFDLHSRQKKKKSTNSIRRSKSPVTADNKSNIAAMFKIPAQVNKCLVT
jgi:hypothetical protein